MYDEIFTNAFITIYDIRILGLPDFLVRMRQASKDYQNYKQSIISSSTSDTRHFPLEDISKEQVKVDVKDTFNNNNNDKKSMKDFKNQQDDSADNTSKLHTIHNVHQENDIVENENKDDANSTPKEEQGLLHYFYLTKLFAFLNL